MNEKIRKLESFADVATLGLIGVLGLAMLVGLATAGGAFG